MTYMTCLSTLEVVTTKRYTNRRILYITLLYADLHYLLTLDKVFLHYTILCWFHNKRGRLYA